MKPSHKITVVFVVLVLVSLGFLITNLNQWLALRQLTIARLALNDRDADKAMNAAREAARLDPHNGEAYFTMARVFRRQAKWGKLRASLEQAAKLGVPSVRIRREEWLVLAQTGQLKEAVPHLGELLLNPMDDGPEICEAFANGFFLMYRLGEAFSILDAWEKDYPQDAQPHFFRAAFSRMTSDWKTTAKHLRKAHELAPNRIDVRIELASMLLILQESDEAAKLLGQLQQIQPNHPEILVGWAQVLLDRGQPENARSTLDQVLRIDPKHIVALRLLGGIHSVAGQIPEAIKVLEEAFAIKKNDRETRYALAMALKRARRDDEARQHFQFVAKFAEVNARIGQLVAKVRSNNDDVESRYEIAELRRKTDDQRERLAWLRSVVALDPNHKAAHAGLAECFAALGDLEASRKHSRLAEAF